MWGDDELPGGLLCVSVAGLVLFIFFPKLPLNLYFFTMSPAFNLMFLSFLLDACLALFGCLAIVTAELLLSGSAPALPPTPLDTLLPVVEMLCCSPDGFLALLVAWWGFSGFREKSCFNSTILNFANKRSDRERDAVICWVCFAPHYQILFPQYTYISAFFDIFS